MSEANVYSIINNPLLQDPAVIQAAVDNIQSTLETLTEYTPAEVNTFVDWSYDAGDIVTLVNDASDYVMPIFSNIVNWNGAGDVTWTNSGNEVRELPTVTQRQTYAHGTAIQAVETGLDEAVEQFTTDIEQTNTYIRLIATETDVETAQTLGQSLFQITSGQISSLVTKVGAVPDGSNLYSLYQQEAGKIALVVGTNQGTNYIKAAEIVTEINGQTGQGVIRLQGDMVEINGTSIVVTGETAAHALHTDEMSCKYFYQMAENGEGDFGVDSAAHFYGDVYFEGDYVFGEDVQMTCEGLTAGALTVTAGEGQGSYSLTPSNLPGMIESVELVSNNTVLRLNRFDGTYLDFNKATSLSGSWSGSILTITASPQGVDYTVEVSGVEVNEPVYPYEEDVGGVVANGYDGTAYDTKYFDLYMTKGQWVNGHCSVDVNYGDTTGDLLSRVWVDSSFTFGPANSSNTMLSFNKNYSLSRSFRYHYITANICGENYTLQIDLGN